MGAALAIFQQSGKTLVAKERLKMSLRDSAKIGSPAFKKKLAMPSGPDPIEPVFSELLKFPPNRSNSTSFSICKLHAILCLKFVCECLQCDLTCWQNLISGECSHETHCPRSRAANWKTL